MSALEASADQSFAQGVVALGLLSEAFLRQSLGVEIVSHTAAGDVETGRPLGPGRAAGRVVEIVAYGLPPGLGSHVQADRRLEARLAAAFFGVAGVCGMEIGEGFEVATRRGSSAHDEIFGHAGDGGVTVYRRTNRAGGLEGGMTNGQPLVARLAKTPARPTTTSIDFDGLTDRDGVSPLGMVGRSLMSLVLMDAVLEKFGGTTLADTRTNARSFIRHLRIRTQAPSADAPANRPAGHSSYSRPISE
jgi:chorismate synthase